MNIGIIGCGAIGTVLAKAVEDIDEIEKVYLLNTISEKAERLAASLKKGIPKQDINDFIDDVRLVVESASIDAVKEYGEFVLSHGKDFMVMSVGAFADKKLMEKLIDTAKTNKCKIYLPSGAIAGVDGVKSASGSRIDEIMLVTRKPPAGLKDVKYLKDKGVDVEKIKKETVVFEGSAYEAIKYFPKNINVAVCLSVAGIGVDKTKVKLVCDPKIRQNIHKIVVKGGFGEITTETKNFPCPTNPRTSYLAALSAVATLKKIVSPLQVGT